MRSESWTFIWQPNVSMRYLRATSSFRFRSFAFAFRFRFAFRLPADAPHVVASGEQFLGRGLQSLRDRAAEHTPDLLNARLPIEPRHAGLRATGDDALLDGEVCVGERGDLRLV